MFTPRTGTSSFSLKAYSWPYHLPLPASASSSSCPVDQSPTANQDLQKTLTQNAQSHSVPFQRPPDQHPPVPQVERSLVLMDRHIIVEGARSLRQMERASSAGSGHSTIKDESKNECEKPHLPPMRNPAHDSRNDEQDWEEVHWEAYNSCITVFLCSVIMALTHCTVNQPTDK